jgi:ribonuclease HII
VICVQTSGRLEAGVDEAGRGPLAGAVFAAAVILDPAQVVEGIRDSKKLSARVREKLAVEIMRCATSWCVARADVHELNILQATFLAMRRAVAGLSHRPALVYVDGNRLPGLDCAAKAVIGGDDLLPCIGAASILAKVARDHEMTGLARLYPEYGFDRHKGYGTPEHLLALRRHGPSPVHRRSFAPVRHSIGNSFARESAS